MLLFCSVNDDSAFHIHSHQHWTLKPLSLLPPLVNGDEKPYIPAKSITNVVPLLWKFANSPKSHNNNNPRPRQMRFDVVNNMRERSNYAKKVIIILWKTSKCKYMSHSLPPLPLSSTTMNVSVCVSHCGRMIHINKYHCHYDYGRPLIINCRGHFLGSFLSHTGLLKWDGKWEWRRESFEFINTKWTAKASYAVMKKSNFPHFRGD